MVDEVTLDKKFHTGLGVEPTMSWDYGKPLLYQYHI